MTKLSWGDPGKRFFEAGVDHGVLYPRVGPGVAWNGLIAVEEAPSGGEADIYYMDGQKYQKRRRREGFEATITAFTYPEEFEEYDGYSDTHLSQQRRKSFNFSYQTRVGNDLVGAELGYQIHLVYNALATPSSKAYKTTDGGIDPTKFSWNISTTPEFFPQGAGAHLIVASLSAYPTALQPLEDMLYGTSDTASHFPTSEELFDIFENAALLKIIDHGDGSWTAIGPDEWIQMLDSTSFAITTPSAYFISDDTYKISSY